jgi:hypothetical protein
MRLWLKLPLLVKGGDHDDRGPLTTDRQKEDHFYNLRRSLVGQGRSQSALSVIGKQ